MLHLLACTTLRRQSSFLVDAFEAREKTTKLAIRLADTIPNALQIHL